MQQIAQARNIYTINNVHAIIDSHHAAYSYINRAHYFHIVTFLTMRTKTTNSRYKSTRVSSPRRNLITRPDYSVMDPGKNIQAEEQALTVLFKHSETLAQVLI